MKEILSYVFSFKGRISRLPYFMIVIITTLSSSHLNTYRADKTQLSGQNLLGVERFVHSGTLPFIVGIIVLYVNFVFAVKRFHDLGYSGKRLLGILLRIGFPSFLLLLASVVAYTVKSNFLGGLFMVFATVWSSVFGLALSAYLCTKEGVRSANEYGPDPLESVK